MQNKIKLIFGICFALIVSFAVVLCINLYRTSHMPMPKNEGMPENPNNQILIFYSNDCSDCQAIKKELYQLSKEDYIHIIDISTTENEEEMKIRNNLRKKYEIFVIPSATYVENETSFYTEPIYTESDGKVIFDNDAFNRVLNCVKTEKDGK